ncbi:MAG: DNA-directed RNA polymerase subunit omega [Candidatus Margulisiibacteriota bacterium]
MSKNSTLNMEELLTKVPNRFVLAIGAARRGRQILEGANPLIASSFSDQPVLEALTEIQADKVEIVMKEVEEI